MNLSEDNALLIVAHGSTVNPDQCFCKCGSAYAVTKLGGEWPTLNVELSISNEKPVARLDCGWLAAPVKCFLN